jgi:hypothetical protein
MISLQTHCTLGPNRLQFKDDGAAANGQALARQSPFSISSMTSCGGGAWRFRPTGGDFSAPMTVTMLACRIPVTVLLSSDTYAEKEWEQVRIEPKQLKNRGKTLLRKEWEHWEGKLMSQNKAKYVVSAKGGNKNSKSLPVNSQRIQRSRRPPDILRPDPSISFTCSCGSAA